MCALLVFFPLLCVVCERAHACGAMCALFCVLPPPPAGCIHSWPENIESIWHILVSLGVQVRNNTNGQLPYPYKSQGLLSVELVD